MAKHNGSALLSALFIVVLVSIATTTMTRYLQQTIQQTRLILASDDLYLASQSIVFWGMSTLHDTSPTKTLVFPVSQQGNVIVSGQLIDLQNRFNLNQLKKTSQEQDNQQTLARFYLLLNQVLGESHAEQHQLIIRATQSWINELPHGSTDYFNKDYQSFNPPYLAPHQLMWHLSEFRTILGVTPHIYKTMEPYLSALPLPTPINLNTVSLPVLMTLGDGISKEDAAAFIQYRDASSLKSLTEVNQFLQQHNISLDQVSLDSDYFLCVANVKTQGLTLTRYTLLKKTKIDRKNIILILQDAFNVS